MGQKDDEWIWWWAGISRLKSQGQLADRIGTMSQSKTESLRPLMSIQAIFRNLCWYSPRSSKVCIGLAQNSCICKTNPFVQSYIGLYRSIQTTDLQPGYPLYRQNFCRIGKSVQVCTSLYSSIKQEKLKLYTFNSTLWIPSSILLLLLCTLIPYKFNYTSNTNTNSTLINIFLVHSYVAKLKL